MTCLATLCLAAHLITVTDGDTIRAGDLRIRLWGIDAPERGETGGAAARDQLAAIIGGAPLACEPVEADRYGRTVAACALPDGTDIACAMVATGHARDWPRYSRGAYAGCGR